MTPSELHVAQLAATGLSNAAIAHARNTSTRTVANQIASVLRELNVASRRALATRADLAPLADAEPASAGDVAWTSLAPREREVLELASHGMQSKVIAIELAISPSTVSEALRSARTRLGFESSAEMIRARCFRTVSSM